MTRCSSSVVDEQPAAAMEFISWAALMIWATSMGFSGASEMFGVFGVVDDIIVLEVVVVAVCTQLSAFVGGLEGAR